MKRPIARRITIHSRERQIFWGLVTIAVSLSGLYMYFLSASIVNILIRKQHQSEIARLHSDISELESEYIVKKNAINAEVASARGFVPTSEKRFVKAASANVALSFNE